MIRAPYVVYGVKYIDPVSLMRPLKAGVMSQSTTNYNLDLGRAPYVVYGVKYIDPVSLMRPLKAGVMPLQGCKCSFQGQSTANYIKSNII